MTKLKNKKNRQRILSILLVFALVITGLFAFLSATDTKTNVFTIGNIKAELWEDFDIDKNGEITDGTNGDPDNVFGPETTQPPTVENILPGDTILKQPYVKNTGSNEEWVYMIVQVPLEDKDDLIAGTNGAIGLTDGATDPVEERVIVTAYAVQDNYNGETTLAGIWGELTATGGPLDASTYFGTASNDSDLVQIFTINGTDTTTWTPLAIGSGTAGAPFKSANGYNYYAYGYSTKLAAKAANESTYPQTSELFQSVTFANAIGETLPVVVNYFAPVSSGSGSSGTGAGEADLSLFTPSIPGYELVHQDQVTPNSPITLYFDDSLVQTGKTFSWIDSETNKEAWTGMTVSGTTNLLANYNNRASASAIEQSYDWLGFMYSCDTNGQLTAQLMSFADTTDENYIAWSESSEPELVVPAFIDATVTQISASPVRYKIQSNYGFSTDAAFSSTSGNYSFSENCPTGSVRIPVTSIRLASRGDIVPYVAKLYLPDTVETVHVSGSPTLKYINIPFSCTTIECVANNSALETIEIPSSVTRIGNNSANAMANLTSIDTLTIPKSVTTIDSAAFNGSTFRRVIFLAENCSIPASIANSLHTSLEYVYFNNNDRANAILCSTASANAQLANNAEYVLSRNVKAFMLSNYINDIISGKITLKYCGTEEEFRSIISADILGNNTRTIGENIDQYNTDISNIIFNYTDPYAA